jgi:hypothetical protein
MTIEERRAKKAERMRAWRARNPERANAIAAACRLRNRAKIAASWKIYYEKNKAKLYEKRKAYCARNREKLRQWKHADYERHRENYKARAHKRWRGKNEECRAYEAMRYQRDKAIIFARHRDYVARNREKVLAWRRSYFKSARGRAVRAASDRRCVKRATAYKNAWARIRRRTNLSYRIGICLRARVGQALRAYQLAQRESVTASITELLGCTVSELVTYLESKFLQQRGVAFHYTNHQPLWAGDNFRKGGRYDVAESTVSTIAEPAFQ